MERQNKNLSKNEALNANEVAMLQRLLKELLSNDNVSIDFANGKRIVKEYRSDEKRFKIKCMKLGDEMTFYMDRESLEKNIVRILQWVV